MRILLQNLSATRCYIIAEIGGNFSTYSEAVALIDAAKLAGVDCVKIQTFTAERISSKGAFFDMEYTGRTAQYDYFKKYEINADLHAKIINYLVNKGLDWFSTPSHPEDVELLMNFGIRAFKIGADDAVNFPFLRYVAKKNKPIFLSTGMCTMEEVRQAVDVILSEGNDRIALFHTVSAYPCHPEYVNLKAIMSLQREFPDLYVGYSDHTITTSAAIAAATMGARMVERHFTLDKNADGPDHKLSSTPDEMKYIVDVIREIEIMQGSGLKRPVGPEVTNRIHNRKSIVALKKIPMGTIINHENISLKRPGTGLKPQYWDQVIGRRATKDIPCDAQLAWSDFE